MGAGVRHTSGISKEGGVGCSSPPGPLGGDPDMGGAGKGWMEAAVVQKPDAGSLGALPVPRGA